MTMKKTYQRPEIWVDELMAECQVLAGSPRPTNEVVSTTSNVGIDYGGGGNGPARANASLWDECDEE
jgi:hypothetical protein